MRLMTCLGLVVLLCLSDYSYGRPRMRYQPAQQYAGVDNSTAQGVANTMARLGYVGHFGGNFVYEGCAMGSTPDSAYNGCCYANSGLTTVDVGWAQGSNGMWYCCRRYR